MDPNVDARLKSIEEKLNKTYDLISKVRRVQRNAQLFKLFYWILIILAALGTFYYIQPYLNQMLETYTGIKNSQEQFQNSITDFGSINDIINQFKGVGSGE
jgi:hypothetical protein